LPWLGRLGTLFVSVLVGLTAFLGVKNRRILLAVKLKLSGELNFSQSASNQGQARWDSGFR
jgi:hypothetical protein